MSDCTVSALALKCQQGPSQATQAFLGSTRWPPTVGNGSLQISPEPWESVFFSCPFHAAKPSQTLIPATLGPPLWKSTAHSSSQDARCHFTRALLASRVSTLAQEF